MADILSNLRKDGSTTAFWVAAAAVSAAFVTVDVVSTGACFHEVEGVALGVAGFSAHPVTLAAITSNAAQTNPERFIVKSLFFETTNLLCKLLD
ncbi:hypothetical protein HA050_20755 [Iodobacter sp. HSC-16F04]|uniref:Uncharacterized protein n=1 Tax=Iodobacter violaceini TaxID=3044271 RepID=A0ABX0KWZ5_9NEIS|nr:hypothetical protein [Iodobacter violacea]NHQ88532.1 hypothetical protein [Iodobacter violacea]